MTHLRRPSAGFTLVEMLLATTLAALLMAGVLAATAALSRDRARMEARQATAHETGPLDLLRRDLTNSAAFVAAPTAAGFDLVGFGGIDPKTLTANGRLAHVAYRIHRPARGGAGVLVREQAYLDDPIKPDHWTEVVAVGVKQVALTTLSADAEPVRLSEDVAEHFLQPGGATPTATRVPSRLRVRIEYDNGVADRDMVLR